MIEKFLASPDAPVLIGAFILGVVCMVADWFTTFRHVPKKGRR